MFLQLDPIKDRLNWYVYVDGNPMVGVDPWGKWCLHIFGGCIGTTCTGDPKCPPAHRKTPEQEREGKALKALLKFWTEQMLSKGCPDIKFGYDIIGLFSGLPEKFRTALATCQEAAFDFESAYRINDLAGMAIACTSCCKAILEAAGKSNAYAYTGCFNSCAKFGPKTPPRYSKGKQ